MSGWRHHWDVLKEALRADRERPKIFVPSRESDFLPAALEVTERQAGSRTGACALLSANMADGGYRLISDIQVSIMR
ncbi:hypothetical protein U5A82_00815 [Sphingobium sp. CR2-8]|uniref:hypothetical protein n=1 Tax=Sphingobium sp. CR2-8 TaxID=1306534 RepID=UPI002DBAF37C|nr:hypothetical protein [Sphingobium sp. CR2-8]MEC3909062.1 hypothetical protein [Sphingobium sp. CR2-8]